MDPVARNPPCAGQPKAHAVHDAVEIAEPVEWLMALFPFPQGSFLHSVFGCEEVVEFRCGSDVSRGICRIRQSDHSLTVVAR
jgi:hypothetical protein